MSHPATQAVPILAVAAALGLEVVGRKARCYNGSAHKSGSDATPALVFMTDVNRYKCHACGVKGDAIDLVRGVRESSFREAVAFLTDLAGSAGSLVPAEGLTQHRTQKGPSRLAKDIYADLLGISYVPKSTSPGGRYLASRGIGLDIADRFEVGELLDPRETWGELRRKFSGAELEAAGLVSRKGRFLFSRHALLFFYNLDGHPQFVQARDVSGKASCKELSVAGFAAPIPYNADVLKEAQEHVVVCEGCIDTLSAAQLGYSAVGVPGVTGFRDDWFPLFRQVRHVSIMFDNDTAGRREAAELRARFRMHRITADCQFPAHGSDVNELLKSLNQGDPHAAD